MEVAQVSKGSRILGFQSRPQASLVVPTSRRTSSQVHRAVPLLTWQGVTSRRSIQVQRQVKRAICCSLAAEEAPAVLSQQAPTKTIRIHYHRKDGQYDDWGLHIWGSASQKTPWDRPLGPSGKGDFGIYFDVELLLEEKTPLEFIVHKGDMKDNAGSITAEQESAFWVVSNRPGYFTEKPDLENLPQGDLKKAKALWIKKDLLVWKVEKTEGQSFCLHACSQAKLELTSQGVTGGIDAIPLKVDEEALTEEVLSKFPYVAGYTALRVPDDINFIQILKGQVAASVVEGGKAVDATSVQLPGVLDDLYAFDGPLGVTFGGNTVSLSVWAPTAQSVRLLLFNNPRGDEPVASRPMTEEKGVWRVTGERQDWLGKYFLYEVKVFSPWMNEIQTSVSTDPYSRSLSCNGLRSQIIDISDNSYKPEGWENLFQEKKPLHVFADIAIYELHVRDFSALDETVHPSLRGTYLAFTEKESAGLKHLQGLAEAGLTHVHLLPSFDFGSVNEDKSRWKSPDAEVAHFASDSDQQQAAVMAIANEDAFNWGYDPVHYGVPDGSYATNPDGPARVTEYRKMVQAINRLGLRVVVDVVYNHVNATGATSPQSNFDKIVPGYYIRRNADGEIENSTCMNNTASEYHMFSRFIVDDLKHWAVNYKVDGFRFDLMGHIMKDTMIRARDTLRGLTLEKDGVDGSKIFLYGEGWDFGEVSNNARGVNASQLNLAGTGIASFNDRIRDAIMGGSPFGDIQLQGFATGLLLNPNELDQGDEENQERALRAYTDWIRLGMVGNLRDYTFTTSSGEMVRMLC